MSSLKYLEKSKLEKLFQMEGGFVLDFTDRSFRDFFNNFEIDIHGEKYSKNGASKAKKIITFWELEDDYIVGNIIHSLIDKIETQSLIDKAEYGVAPDQNEKERQLLGECREIVERLLSRYTNFDSLKQIASNFEHIDKQIKRMDGSIVNDDPELTIGTAKDFLETCCKTILADRGKPISNNITMPKLIKATLEELKLVPTGVSDEKRGNKVIKSILRHLGGIGHDLVELRGLYGTGHGREGNSKGLSMRHAKLSSGAVRTLVAFLLETHEETKD